jgi:dihydroorotate dehydrogenase electron transfer subunit
MIQTLGTVLRNEMLAPNYGRVGLSCDGHFSRSKPGQFVMLGFPGIIDPLLRRPFSIHRLITVGGRFEGIELLYKTVGPATRRLSRLKAGEAVSLLGPLGSAFQVPSGVRRMYLAAGGVGVAPMVFLIEWLHTLRSHLPECRLFLGGRSQEDLQCVDDFERWGISVVLTTDDGSCGDQCLVTNPLEEAIRREPPDLVLACGPESMLACVLGIVAARRIACQVSVETMMACGMGACLGCAVRGRQDGSRFLHACLDGPVFDAEDIELS